MEYLHTFGRRHQRDENDVLCSYAAFLQNVDGIHGGVAGRHHRIAQDHGAVLQVGQAHQVFHGLMLVVAIHADVADPRRRNQFQQAVAHADAGAQYGNHGQLLARNHRRVVGDQRRFNRLGSQRQVARDFVAHQQGDLAQQVAEGARRGALVAHVRELVLDQRVVEDEQIGEAGILFHDLISWSYRSGPQACGNAALSHAGRCGQGIQGRLLTPAEHHLLRQHPFRRRCHVDQSQ